MPIIFLTAKDTVDDTVFGLEAGANDYLKKPFAFEELLARIRVLLRNKTGEQNIFDSRRYIDEYRSYTWLPKTGNRLNLLKKNLPCLNTCFAIKARFAGVPVSLKKYGISILKKTLQ